MAVDNAFTKLHERLEPENIGFIIEGEGLWISVENLGNNTEFVPREDLPDDICTLAVGPGWQPITWDEIVYSNRDGTFGSFVGLLQGSNGTMGCFVTQGESGEYPELCTDGALMLKSEAAEFKGWAVEV